MKSFQHTLAAARRAILALVIAGLVIGANGSGAAAADVSSGVAQSIDEKFAEVGQRVPQFGGMYIRGKTVLVVLLDTSPRVLTAAQDAIIAVFGRDRLPTGGFVAVQGQYDVLQLKSLRARARSVLSISGVSLIDLDERKNRVRIGIERAEVRAEVERLLGALHVPLEAVSIELVRPTSLTLNTDDAVRPVKSAPQISNGGGNCTLGLVVKLSSVRGMLTASHCTKTQGGTEGTAFTQPAGGEQIGIELLDPVYATYPTNSVCPTGRRCRWSDSSFSVLDSDVLSYRGTIARPVNAFPGDINIYASDGYPGDSKVEAGLLFPIAGEVLSKFGQNSGLTQGEVISTCYDTNVATSDITLLCQDQVNAVAIPGDSGSAVYDPASPAAPNGAAFNGLLWGSDGSTFAFSSYWAIEMELGTGIGSLNVLHQVDPPSIQIVQPSNGANVAYNSFATTFTAKVTDPDAQCPKLCQVNWHSDKDGDMGGGLTIQYIFAGPGARTITATVTKNNGMSATASITVNTGGNTPPLVWITKPTAGQTLQKGAPYVFEGNSSDKELFGPLPCSALSWTTSVAGDPSPTGCAPKVTFTSAGIRTVTLTGTDADGATTKDTVLVVVVEPPANSPPVVAILEPGPSAYLDAFTFVTLKGTAKDPDPGPVSSPLAYQWRIKDGATETQIGSGTLVVNGAQTTMQWKPADTVSPSCGGSWVKIYLYVTDGDGLTASDFKEVKVVFGSC
jgi:hypothetical protein